MSKFRWELNTSQSAWLYYEDSTGRITGSVALIRDDTFGVFVRQERLEPLRWVTHVDNLDEAKALVQTLVGASNV